MVWLLAIAALLAADLAAVPAIYLSNDHAHVATSRPWPTTEMSSFFTAIQTPSVEGWSVL
ncbi:hypothetical protein DMB37_28535 [Nocardia sp. CS682]|nr:hypothetical protein DMB37_28535 [Nocardia sp. CS682]